MIILSRNIKWAGTNALPRPTQQALTALTGCISLKKVPGTILVPGNLARLFYFAHVPLYWA